MVRAMGKKKAFDMLYRLSMCLNGLSVSEISAKPKDRDGEPGRKRGNEYFRKWRTKNREKVKSYQREYRSRKKR